MPDNKQMDSYIEMFIFEANQLTEQLESILLESEENQNISEENINEIFRIMHTIKGSAAMMSFSDISNIAHTLEDLFSFIREKKPVIDVSDTCDKVFKVLDYIRYQIELLANGKEVQKLDEALAQTIRSYVEQIKSNNAAKAAEKTKPAGKEKPAEEAGEPEKAAGKAGAKTAQYKATVFFDDFCSLLSARAFMVINRLGEHCTNITNFPELNNSDNTVGYIMQNGLEINFESSLTPEEIKDIIEDITDVKTAVVQLMGSIEKKEEAEEEPPAEKAQPQAESAESKEPAEARAAAEYREPAGDKARPNVKQNIISVNINKLDKLINIVGEIVISESMVINNPDLEGMSLENFSKSAMQLRKLTDELQDLVLSVRMIPVEMIFSKMHRIVRDMGKKLEKEVNLEIIGEDTEVDKNVLDNLSDPLMHLIRNSMDHGIEPRDERIKNGKSPVGRITLEAKNTGGEVIITVSDDGRGLDKQKILDKARDKGLLKGENLTDQEIFNLILLPGFSTKEKVTEFSGRGVGMDVVKQNVEKVGGNIFVDSEQGKGTTMTIRLPLTLAIIDGMMVKVGENVYIIPTQSISQCIKPSQGSVFSDTQGRDMIIVRGSCYAITKLQTLFNIEGAVTDYSKGVIIMTEYNGRTVCLFADKLMGQQPVVVKSLPEYLNKFNSKETGIGGCTILGDGSISLILDIAEIANK